MAIVNPTEIKIPTFEQSVRVPTNWQGPREEVIMATTTGAPYKPTLRLGVNIYQESNIFSPLIRSSVGRSRIVAQHLSSGLPLCVFEAATDSVMRRRWILSTFSDICL